MDVRLIEEVSQWPVLYNAQCEEYRNVELKNRAWRAITSSLLGHCDPVFVEKVRNKWKNLRDTFVKSQRKKDRPNSRPWKFEEIMMFLKPHINTKVPFTMGNNTLEGLNLSVGSRYTPSPEEFPNENSWRVDITKNYSEEDDPKVDVLQHVEIVMEDSPSKNNEQNKPKKRKRKEHLRSPVFPGVHFMENSEQLLNQTLNPCHSYDSEDYFFLSLASSVKRMRPSNQIMLKKAIANLVLDAELKELESTNDKEAIPSS